MHNTFLSGLHANTGGIRGGPKAPFSKDLNEVLLLELRHRIHNDLQAILGSIELERHRAKDERSRDLLDGIVGRVACVAAVYELLHTSSLATINLGEYLHVLCSRVAAARGIDGNRMALNASLISVDMTMDQAVLLGLIVNELTTNAVKHAFKDGESGRIFVQLRRANEDVELIVGDNGRRESEMARRGQGLGLVHRLARQVGGTLSCEHANGTVWRMIFNPVRPVYSDAPQQGV